MIRHCLKVLGARRSPSLVLAAVALVAGSLGPAVTPTSASPAPEDPTDNTTNDTTDDGTNGNDNCPTGSGQTAAAALGYTNPTFADDFDTFDESKWMPYSGPSQHEYGEFDAQGGGRRRREQISVDAGVMTITGLPNGDTAGMSTQESHRQLYGLWEARVKLPANAVDYHSVLILMAGPEPEGGQAAELDFVEVMEPSGRQVHGYLHMPGGESHGQTTLQDNEWHNWAIEWTPQGIRLFLDGRQWHATEPGTTIPSSAGHMTIQLDWFPQDRGETTRTELAVDWVRVYRQSNGATSNNTVNTAAHTNAAAADADCPTTCPNGTNSLGQCQNPNGGGGANQAGCRWYEHPEQSFVAQFAPNAPQGSVLLFYACYDQQTGVVTAASSAPEAGGSVGPVPVRLARPDERPCDDQLSRTQTNDQQQANGQQTNSTQPSDRQPDDDNGQQQDDQQANGQQQDCYHRLPANARFHPDVAIGLLLTNSQVQLSEAPELLTTPPVGQPAIVGQPTFVCVTNFPSGTNFPGAASVPENRRRRTGNGQSGNQQPDQTGDRDGDRQTPDDSSTTTSPAPQQASHGQHSPDGGDVQALGGRGAGQRLGIMGNAAQEGDDRQTGDQSNDQQAPQRDSDQQDRDQQQDNGQQTGDQGNGSFSPGVVGSLTAGQQACLQAQTGNSGSGTNGSGQDDTTQQASQSTGDDDRDQQGAGNGQSSGRDDGGSGNGNGGSGNDSGGQGPGSGGLNQPVNGLCAPAAHVPTGQTGGAPTGQPGQPGEVPGTVVPGDAATPGHDADTAPDGQDQQAPDQQAPDQQAPPSAQVTDPTSGSNVAACVRVQLYPTIRWDPGDGTPAFECAAPGTVYGGAQGSSGQQQPGEQQSGEEQPDQQPGQAQSGQQTSQQPGQQQFDATDCVHAYSKETGREDPETGEARPDAWPGKVSVVWRADYDNCLVHAAGGSTQYSAGAGHEANYVDTNAMAFDFASLGEGGQAPNPSQTGEVSSGNAYAGTYNVGLNDDGVQSATTPLPRQVVPVSGLNTGGNG